MTCLCENIYLGITICSVIFSTFGIPVVLRGKVFNDICSVLSYYLLKLPSSLKTKLDNIADRLDVSTSVLLLKYFFFKLGNKFCVVELKRIFLKAFFDTFLDLWFQNSRCKLVFNIIIFKNFPKISRKSTITWGRLGLLLYGKITPKMKVCVNNFA